MTAVRTGSSKVKQLVLLLISWGHLHPSYVEYLPITQDIDMSVAEHLAALTFHGFDLVYSVGQQQHIVQQLADGVALSFVGIGCEMHSVVLRRQNEFMNIGAVDVLIGHGHTGPRVVLAIDEDDGLGGVLSTTFSSFHQKKS